MSYTYINRKLEEFNKSIENKKIDIKSKIPEDIDMLFNI